MVDLIIRILVVAGAVLGYLTIAALIISWSVMRAQEHADAEQNSDE